MDSKHKLLFTVLLIVAAAIGGAQGDATVTGTVFCDQCKDGQLTLFDYPLYGTKVIVACPGSNGQITMTKEATTTWFGNFLMRIEGTPDLSGCYAQVSGGDQGSTGCGAVAGRARNLRLTFRMFDFEIYRVDSLFSEPAQPMSFCPRSSNPVPTPTPVRTLPSPPPPFRLPPSSPVPVPVTPTRPPPAFRFPPMPWFPPMPRLPPLPRLPPMPPFPFIEASACPHEYWTMPQYKCYWRVVNPDTRVAAIFGLVAARRYGTDMTLWQGLQGRGDPYRTLLREGITSFLNSCNSLQFRYNTIGVVLNLNSALVGSPRNLLLTALRFKRANSGSDNITCKFTPCH